jgi:hypothetical protein
MAAQSISSTNGQTLAIPVALRSPGFLSRRALVRISPATTAALGPAHQPDAGTLAAKLAPLKASAMPSRNRGEPTFDPRGGADRLQAGGSLSSTSRRSILIFVKRFTAVEKRIFAQ